MTYTSDELKEMFRCCLMNSPDDFEWRKISTNTYAAKYTTLIYDEKENRMLHGTIELAAIVPTVDELGDVQFLIMSGDEARKWETDNVNKL